MSSIILNESEWNRIKTKYITEIENKKRQSLAIKRNKFHSGNENEKKKQMRSDEEDRIEKKRWEILEEEEEEEERNFSAGDILKFVKKGTKSGSLESEWRRRILSGAALAAILYERDNQLHFTNEQNKFREKKKKIKIEENNEKEKMNWSERTKFEKVSKEKLIEVLNSQLNERKVKEEKKKLERMMEREMLDKMMKKHLEQVRKEAEEKRWEKMKAKEEMANDMEERRRRKSKEKKREMEEEELRNVFKQVEERLERKKKIMEKLLLESEAKKKVGKAFEKIIENANAKNPDRSSDEFKIYEKKLPEKTKAAKSLNEKLMRELEKGGKRGEEDAKKNLIKDEMRKERESRLDFDNRWNQEEKKIVKNEKKKIFVENIQKRNHRREKDREKSCFLAEETDNKDINGFCEFVLKEAEVHKRPLFPVLAAIDDVKRQYGLIKRNKKIRHLLSSF